jgi:hypothetical protein
LVELLDDVADEQRDGEQDDDPPGATGGEDLGHSETFGLAGEGERPRWSVVPGRVVPRSYRYDPPWAKAFSRRFE